MESQEVDIARMMNVTYDNETGQVFITMEVTDPVWRQRLMRDWENLEVKLVVEEKQDAVL